MIINILLIFFSFILSSFIIYYIYVITYTETFSNDNLGKHIGYLINQSIDYDYANNSWKLYMIENGNSSNKKVFLMTPSNTNNDPLLIIWIPHIFENNIVPNNQKEIPSLITFKHPYLHSSPYNFVTLENTYF